MMSDTAEKQINPKMTHHVMWVDSMLLRKLGMRVVLCGRGLRLLLRLHRAVRGHHWLNRMRFG